MTGESLAMRASVSGQEKFWCVRGALVTVGVEEDLMVKISVAMACGSITDMECF